MRISCALNKTQQIVSPSSHNLCIVLQKACVGFPVTETWPITRRKWPNCVHIICFCHWQLSKSEWVSVIIPHLALCESNEREWALGPGVGEDQETSVRVFPLSASGARPDVEAMGYVTPIRREGTPPPQLTGSCHQSPSHEKHWRWPTGSHSSLTVIYN